MYVSFDLRILDYSTAKLYGLFFIDVKQMFTAVLKSEGNQAIRVS